MTIDDCIKQLKMYAENCLDLGNKERSIGFQKSAEFLEKYYKAEMVDKNE